LGTERERETERKRFVEGQWSFFFVVVVADRGGGSCSLDTHHGSLEALGLDILEELLDLLQVLLPRLLKRLDVLPVRILCVHRAHTLHHTVDPLVRLGDHLGGDVLNLGYDGHAVGLDGTLERLDPGAKGCRGLLLHKVVILGRQVGGQGAILEQKPQTLELLALHGLAGVRRHGSLGWRPPWG